MSLESELRDRIAALIEGNDVMLFMKGDRAMPQCGFSATVVKILDGYLPAYQTFDVLSDAEVREGIKEYSAWPTIPQLYIKGEFVGGCDIIREIHGTGELAGLLGIELGSGEPPPLAISDAAAEALRGATAGAPPEHALHLGIDARYQSTLFLAPAAEGELVAQANGIEVHMDPLTASRATDARIDAVDTPNGPGFQVHLPHAPLRVGQLDVQELARMIEDGERFEFLDVRTPEERATASIPGTVLLDEDVVKRLESLPRETPLVFHCHHGGRSQAAAEHFVGLGFTNVFNVVGGIDAWSQEIDPEVPRY
jgi:monothiol glutaredoxin